MNKNYMWGFAAVFVLLLAVGLTSSGQIMQGSLFDDESINPNAAGQDYTADGESTSSNVLRTFNVLSNSGCGDSSYEHCTSNTNEFQWAEAEAQLEVNTPDSVYTSNGVKYVEAGAQIEYRCGEPRPNDDVDHTMYLWDNGVSPSYKVSGQSLVPDKSGATEIGNEGRVSVSFSSANEITLSCVGSHELNNDWAATTAGFTFPPMAEAEDSDGDGIYDINDECSNQRGTEETGGCPDTDGDGVRDSEDKFPNDADCVEDSDGDGVCDSEDAFPNDPSKQYDQDGDGIADSADQCPTRSGPERFDGCPDSDGDGIPDNQDQCPETGSQGFGVNEDGCPVADTDSDGVPDTEDECSGTPDEASVDDSGCAVDSDSDGVPDYRDECPNTGGQGMGLDSSGCPVSDADRDGVTDSADQCPETWGSKQNGCPTIIDSIVNSIGLRGVLS